MTTRPPPETLEYAHYMLTELACEITRCVEQAKEHAPDCCARALIRRDIDVLEAAKRYFEHMAESKAAEQKEPLFDDELPDGPPASHRWDETLKCFVLDRGGDDVDGYRADITEQLELPLIDRQEPDWWLPPEEQSP